MARSRRWFLALGALLGLALLAACGDDDVGSACDDHDDCSSETFCCHGHGCGEGMCTYSCRRDSECPDDMRCQDEACLFTCAMDRECGIGFECRERGGDFLCVAD